MSKRQLAAIMFTDIVGYTALMGRNEKKALDLLEKNRGIHQTMIAKFNGQLLKEMGDGVMASFGNTYDAVMCSAAIRRASLQQQYQLRIGLHEGEIIIKNDDIFGEGVNIASRLEALADEGQILITESVYRNIHNKQGILTEMLGEKYLKNVSESWRLYALFVDDEILDKELARRKEPKSENKEKMKMGLIKWLIIGFVGTGLGATLWMNLSAGKRIEGFTAQEVNLLRDKTVTVLPFIGSASGWLDEFGAMAPYWISRSLLEVTEGKVIDAGSAEKYEDITKDFIERTSLDIVIEGRYFKMDAASHDLELFVDLIDLSTYEKRSLGHFKGFSSEPEKILDQATQKITSIWALSGKTRWAENPPRYDAFREYQTADKTWGSDYNKSIDHLMKAYELDTTFYEALLKISTAYGNMGRRADADSLVNFIRDQNPALDPWTQMRLEYMSVIMKDDIHQAAKIVFRMAEYDPNDVITLYNASNSAYRIGLPDQALAFGDQCLVLYPNPECRTGSFFYHPRFGSYFALGRYEEIIDELYALECVPNNWFCQAYPIKACVRLDRFDLIDTLLSMYAESTLGIANDQRDWLYEVVVKELYMMGKMEMMKRYIDHLVKSKHGHDHWGQFFNGDFEAPIEKCKAILQEDSSNYSSWGDLAFMLTNSGDTLSVHQMLSELEQRPNRKYGRGSRTYYLGTLNALVGNRKLATDLLEEAHKEGVPFGFRLYADDFRLTNLFDYPPFQELVKPREFVE